jgi:hypothetical protein
MIYKNIIIIIIIIIIIMWMRLLVTEINLSEERLFSSPERSSRYISFIHSLTTFGCSVYS